VTGRDLTYLRTQLASVGILLAEPTSLPPRGDLATSAEPVDRELVRVILVDAGAPLADLEWLVTSCPSVDDALNYQPPCNGAWFGRTEAGTQPQRLTSSGYGAPAGAPRLGEPALWSRGS
jgi:hypothetical protein